MNDHDDEEPVGLICVRCGEANDARASRCSECKSPLDDFAASAPWEMGTARSSAYSPVSSPKAKPIIFWGAWLYFGPSAMGSLWFVGVSIYGLIAGEPMGVSDLSGGSILILLVVSLYGALSTWALWSVSKGYFGKAKDAAQGDARSEDL